MRRMSVAAASGEQGGQSRGWLGTHQQHHIIAGRAKGTWNTSSAKK